MCGIFAYLAQHDLSKIQDHLRQCSHQIQHRGPDNSRELRVQSKDFEVYFGFHRLAINGLDHESDEPLVHNNLYLICNGEIYNHKQLIETYQLPVTTHNDCEVILHLYQKFGFPHTLHLLDGVFAFVLFDTERDEIFIANDSIGIRPLYIGTTQPKDQSKQAAIALASEPIALKDCSPSSLEFFPPGCYLRITNQQSLKDQITNRKMNYQRYYNYQYNLLPLQGITPSSPEPQLNQIKQQYQTLLIQAVEKRITNRERPLACLLSGGLDSSLVSSISAHLLKHHPEVKSNKNHKLATFSIGLPDSPDTKYAQIVAAHIGSDHTTVTVQEKDFLDAIPEVIRAIQSYDITTVRASVGNYLISKYISTQTPYKVILNGDVSEEINASYYYSKFAPNLHDLYQDNLTLLKEVHMYDVLRSARCIENQGLEARTPFADKQLVDFVMSLPPSLKQFGPGSGIPNFFGSPGKPYVEKQILREAFEGDWLPNEVLWRPKTAFSDGVSQKKRSWHQIIQEHIEKTLMTDEDWKEFAKAQLEPPYPPTPEAYYYLKIYKEVFDNPASQPHTLKLIPKYWMPRFVDNHSNDPSARVLLTEDEDR